MNAIKINLIISVSMLCFFSCFSQTPQKLTQQISQKISNPNTNLYDANGLKTGMWIEYDGTKEIYYKNGKRNVFFRSYDPMTGMLDGFGEYLDDQPVGTWYYFGQYGHLSFIEKDICAYHGKIKTGDNIEVTPKYKSYLILYYPNGEKKEEGYVLYFEDIEMEYYEIGTWKYYDNTGKLVNIIDKKCPVLK